MANAQIVMQARGLVKRICMSMGHSAQPPLQKQAVDVDPNVVVIEWQVRRPGHNKAIRSRVIAQAGSPFGRLMVEEDRPTLLQEDEERFAI